jgi:CRP-like cAMP-binding protein
MGDVSQPALLGLPGSSDPIDRSFLRHIALFGGLGDESLDRLARRLRRRLLPAAAAVVTEGDRAREMYVVEQGEVEVMVHRRVRREGDNADDLMLAVLRRGACFGEMSLLDIQPRSATVRTRSDASLLVLGYGDLLEVQTSDQEAFTLLVMNIAREVSRRLRLANQVLVDVLLSLKNSQDISQELFGGPLCPPSEVRLKS